MKPAALIACLSYGIVLLAVPASVVGQSIAPAPATPNASCLTEREVQAVTIWLLPEGIDRVARRCLSALPSSAFLTVSGAALAERYRGERSSDGDLAKRALARVGGGLPLSLFSDEISGAVIVEAATQQLKAGDCAKADRLVALLSPLPRASIGEVAAMLIATGLRNADTSRLPVHLCSAPR